MRAVLDEDDLALIAELAQALQIRRNPERVLCDHRARPWRDFSFYIIDIQVQCIAVDIHIDGNASGGMNCIRHDDAGVGLNDHFLAVEDLHHPE